jgi:hypothetical protein
LVCKSDRVRANTSRPALHDIDSEIARNVRYYRDQPRNAISRRIDELDQEWDIERILETNASTLALAGVALGLTVNRKWLLLSAGVLTFLLQHAVQGWCPPITALRKLGIRTQGEIDREKYILKAIRGDFDPLMTDATH